MTLLTELQAALSGLGIQCVLARRHRLVLRYTENPVPPSGRTDPTLHVFAPAGTLDQIRPLLEETLARAAADRINEAHQLGQLIRRTVGKWVNNNYRRRPMIIPVVVEV